jgi:malonyl-CoA/methylmalonyl-CoA synthetase
MTAPTPAAIPFDTTGIEGLVERALDAGSRAAVVEPDGTTTDYRALVDRSARVAAALLGTSDDLDQRRVAFMVRPSADYVAVLWGIMRAGGIGVPILPGLPAAEVDYLLDDSGAGILVVDDAAREHLGAAASARRLVTAAQAQEAALRGVVPGLRAEQGCLVVYTSGSTGRPKGAVWTHRALATQLAVLNEAWGWVPGDVSLLTLPLHHVHGIVNVLMSSLWAGAACRILTKADPERIWAELEQVSVFMSVPTIYHRLIAAWDSADPAERARRTEACHRVRLMVSGSAALPGPVMDRWREISGHMLLERYGMTELGMVLSNPLHGDRLPGTVGRPLPTVETRIVDDGRVVTPPGEGVLEVRGPSVMREYWNRPEATAEAFHDGWFVTGDRVGVDASGVHRIIGRESTDIIKTGGEKVSALEIEEVLRHHETIVECAVVGVPDAEWGERVAAAVVASGPVDRDELRAWARPRLARYKIPSLVVQVDALPRNAMGKVVKLQVRSLIEESVDR